MPESGSGDFGVEQWAQQASNALGKLRALGVDAIAHEGRLLGLGDTDRVYRVFFESMGEAAATLDEDGVVLHANHRLSILFGISVDAVRGSCLLAALSGLPSTLPEEGAWRGRVLLHARQGVHPCLCTLVSIRTEGARTFRCIVLSDLAELERAQREADAGQRALAGLASAAPGGLFRMQWRGGIARLEFATDEVFLLLGIAPQRGSDAASALWRALPAAAGASLAAAWGNRGDHWQLDCEFPMADATSAPRWLGLEARGGLETDGSEVWNGYLHDITQAKRGEEERRLAAAVFQSVRQGIMVASPEGEILHVNPGFERITGYRADEAIGRPAKMLASGLTPKEVHAGMWAALLETGHWEGEVINRRRSGEIYHELLTIDGVPSADGGMACYVGVFSDNTARKKREEQNLFIAQHDRLTGLFNRSVLDERLPDLLAHAERAGMGCAVLYIDLDHFKAINDTFGHETGDRLLVEVANRLRAAVRSTDLVARIGGDEFVIVLPGLVDDDHIHRLCETLISAVQTPVDGVGECADGGVGASIGIAIYPEDARIGESLLALADGAMYVAKRRGRGGFRFASELRNDNLRERIRQTDDIGRALDSGRVVSVHRRFECTGGSTDPRSLPALFGFQCVDELGLAHGEPFVLERLNPALTVAANLKTVELAIGSDVACAVREVRLANDLLEDEAACGQLEALLGNALSQGTSVAFRFPWRQLEALSAASASRLQSLRNRGVRLHVDGVDAETPLLALLAGRRPSMVILDAPGPRTPPMDAFALFIRAFVTACGVCDVVPAAEASPAWERFGGPALLGLPLIAPVDVVDGGVA